MWTKKFFGHNCRINIESRLKFFFFKRLSFLIRPLGHTILQQNLFRTNRNNMYIQIFHETASVKLDVEIQNYDLDDIKFVKKIFF